MRQELQLNTKIARIMIGVLSVSSLEILIIFLEPSLLVGDWYTIDLKNTGRLTYSKYKDNEGHHVQTVYGAHTNDYSDGGQFYEDAQWAFAPAPEKPNHFLLVNKSLPTAVVTHDGDSTNGKWVVAIPDKKDHPDYQPGGSKRDDALWTLEREQDTDFYHLFNSGFPENGILTWAAKSIDSGTKYSQIYNSGTAESSKHGKNYLWQIVKVVESDD